MRWELTKGLMAVILAIMIIIIAKQCALAVDCDVRLIAEGPFPVWDASPCSAKVVRHRKPRVRHVKVHAKHVTEVSAANHLAPPSKPIDIVIEQEREVTLDELFGSKTYFPDHSYAGALPGSSAPHAEEPDHTQPGADAAAFITPTPSGRAQRTVVPAIIRRGWPAATP